MGTPGYCSSAEVGYLGDGQARATMQKLQVHFSEGGRDVAQTTDHCHHALSYPGVTGS